MLWYMIVEVVIGTIDASIPILSIIPFSTVRSFRTILVVVHFYVSKNTERLSLLRDTLQWKDFLCYKKWKKIYNSSTNFLFLPYVKLYFTTHSCSALIHFRNWCDVGHNPGNFPMPLTFVFSFSSVKPPPPLFRLPTLDGTWHIGTCEGLWLGPFCFT